MSRGQRPQPWMKLHGSFLDSSINYELDLSEQAVFLKICLYSLRCGGDPGIICDNDGNPIPTWFMANCIHAPIEVVNETIKKCIETKRFRKNGNRLEVINWRHYQSEYERQKPYRERKKKEKTAAEREAEDKENRYRLREREEIKKYQKEHGSSPIGDDYGVIKNRVAAEIYGGEDAEKGVRCCEN